MQRGSAVKSPRRSAAVGTTAPVTGAALYLAQTGIAEEEEGLVVLDGAADGSAEIVAVVRGLDSVGAGILHVYALKSVLRLNSNNPPWNLFVPDFVITETTAAENWPYSAENALVSTRNSSIASGLGAGLP